MKKSIIMTGGRSPVDSAFAVFEHFKDWTGIRSIKVIPDGAYFAVLMLSQKDKADIAPNLFVQGYRPHSSGTFVTVDRRRYGAFVPDWEDAQAKDDVKFLQAQLYQVLGAQEVRLVLKDSERYQKSAILNLVDGICQERAYTQLNEVRQYVYRASEAKGYFLANREYHVWGVMVGQNVDGLLVKKMLIVDYHTGIPAVVPYVDEHFRLK